MYAPLSCCDRGKQCVERGVVDIEECSQRFLLHPGRNNLKCEPSGYSSVSRMGNDKVPKVPQGSLFFLLSLP